jgi:hypothetical protein
LLTVRRPWLTASIAAPVLIAIAVSSVFVGLRLASAADGDITKFVVAGSVFTDPEEAPEGLAILPNVGYDANFYYRLALDPLNFDKTAFGITIEGDQQLRRDRILYPAIVYVVSAGSQAVVPWAMVIVNILAMGAIAGFGALLARAGNRAPLWGLLFLSFPLMFFSLGRDLTEPLEVALLLGGLVALRQSRWWWATAAFSGAVLTRETALLVVGAFALERIWCWIRREASPGVRDLSWAVPGAVFAAWQGVIHLETGRFGFTAGDEGTTAPLFGVPDFVDSLTDRFRDLSAGNLLINAEAVVLLGVIVLGVAALRATTTPRHERCAFVVLAVFASMFLGAGSWLQEGGPRAFADVYALAVLMLLATPWRLRVPTAIVGAVSLGAMVQLVRFI